jgi:hypothetical protein
MQDYQLLEKMATFNRERLPERILNDSNYTSPFYNLTLFTSNFH